ncbi:MAG: KTSC domain-containing protein [Ferrovibrio sp.]
MTWFDSTTILRAEYERKTATLQLWFRESGGPYDYRDVPPDIFEGFATLLRRVATTTSLSATTTRLSPQPHPASVRL